MKKGLTDKIPFAYKLLFKKWRAKILSGAKQENKPYPKPSNKNGNGKHSFSVIVFNDSLPEFDRDSGSLRLFTILRILAQRGKVKFVPLYVKRCDFYESELAENGVETISAFDFQNELKREKYDYAILSRGEVAEKVFSLVRRRSPQTKIIYDTVDVHFVRLQREYELTGDENLLPEIDKMKQIETRLARQSDQVWCVTEQDERFLCKLAPESDYQIVSNIHYPESRGLSFDGRAGILFVGGFAHRPNRDAVLFFLNEIFPLVLQKTPDAKFYIVGSDPPPEISARESKNVIVKGFVPDVAPLFENCRVFVAPLRYGAGMKGKVGQALAFGLPTVTTNIGAEGMNLTNGREVLISDSPADFAANVCRVYEDANLWQNLSNAGREYIIKTLSPDVVEEKIIKALRKLKSGEVEKIEKIEKSKKIDYES
ncbi:MAG TPA: glycosyltransferase [Pyrinomonadaceae bacterium]|jgi:glycosyltransferase involved in cell wall biosynthesis